MIEHAHYLVKLVDAFLAGECDFKSFADQYQNHLLEVVPEDYFSSCELLVLSEVHERAEWTTSAPSGEDRVYGWIDVGEFVTWLRAYRASLPRLLPGRVVQD